MEQVYQLETTGAGDHCITPRVMATRKLSDTLYLMVFTLNNILNIVAVN